MVGERAMPSLQLLAVLDGIERGRLPLAGRGLGEETAEQDKTGDHISDGLQVLCVMRAGRIDRRMGHGGGRAIAKACGVCCVA
jgi:hypothetical protein